MDVKTPREFLVDVLPGKFDGNQAAGIAAVVQLNIAGDNGGQWYLTIKDGKLETSEGAAPSPNMTIAMKDVNYVALVNGKLSGQRAFMTGKLKFKGDMKLGMKLQKLGLI